MTRAADIEHGIDTYPEPLVLPDSKTAYDVVRRIRETPRMGDAWMLYSGYEQGWIIEWYPKGKRSGNALVYANGVAYDLQRGVVVKTGLPVEDRNDLARSIGW